MAAKQGFWNSQRQANGVGDRLYNAEDLSFFYDLFFTNGIACANDLVGDMFKVSLTNGSYTVKINNGVCIIGGKWYNGQGEAAISLSMNTSHVVSSGKSRIDAVCVRKDDVNRKFSFYIKEGEEALSPVVPEIDKNVELCLGYYSIGSSYTVDYGSLVDSRHDDTLCGCAKLKLDKPAYDSRINDHIQKSYYIANGTNDNITLSTLVQDYLKKEKDKDLEINVIGNIGVQGFFAGSGTPADPKVIFALGGYGETEANKNKVIINFVDSAPFSYSDAGTHSNNIIVFAGSNLRIKNVKIQVNAKSSAAVYIYRHYTGEITDSYLKVVNDAGQAYALWGAGKFENNDIVVVTNADVARAIVPSSKIINTIHGRIPLFLKNNRLLSCTKTGTASTIYTNFADNQALIIATENEFYKSPDEVYKTNTAYQISSGSAILQNNICELTGTVYTPADATQTVVHENNIIVDSLNSKKVLNYYFS